MTKNFTSRSTFILSVLIAVALFTACHKNPINTSVEPVPAVGWTRVNSIPDVKVRVLEVAGNTIYAGSISGIVYSSVNGTNWAASTAINGAGDITALTVFKSKIYVGTEIGGVFTSTNAGSTWNVNYPYIAEVSSFVKLNDTLYNSSSGYSGIGVLNEANGLWSQFNTNGLPTNYNLDVEKIITANNTLVSVQGVNGNYYLYHKDTRTWSEEYFKASTYTPGLRISDIISDSNLFFAATNDAVLISDNTAHNWSYDTVGLKKGRNPFQARQIYAGADFYYTLNYVEGKGSWLQKKHRPLPGSSWAANEEFLPDLYTYAIREFNGMLFIATDHGVYYKPLH